MDAMSTIVTRWELAFTLLDKLDSLSRRAIFQSFQTLLRSKKREKVRRFFLNLTFSRRKSGRRGPLMIANMQNSAFRCLVWVSGSGGGGAGRVVWGYGYHVVVHRRPATA